MGYGGDIIELQRAVDQGVRGENLLEQCRPCAGQADNKNRILRYTARDTKFFKEISATEFLL